MKPAIAQSAKKRSTRFFLALLTGLLTIAAVFFSASMGSADISFRDAAGIILNQLLPFLHWHYPVLMKNIVLELRLPRILLSLIVGMGLACSGVVFQGVFRNPMADPYILGISSGAAFGVTLVTVSSIPLSAMGGMLLPAAAFAGAIAAALLVLLISGGMKQTSLIPLLLSGVAVSFLLSAAISLLMYLHRDEAQRILFWTFGSFASPAWRKVIISGWIFLTGQALIFLFHRDLDLLTLGEESAMSLGLRVRRTRLLLLGTATVMTASAVMVSGIIGFIGLIVPHAVRLITGPRHKLLIPWSMRAGGLFCLVSDTIARSIMPPSEIPVGIITALFGAPYFLFLLRRRTGRFS